VCSVLGSAWLWSVDTYTETATHEKSAPAAHVSCDGNKRATRISYYAFHSIVFPVCARRHETLPKPNPRRRFTETSASSVSGTALQASSSSSWHTSSPGLHENTLWVATGQQLQYQYQFPLKCTKLWPPKCTP
jgi:hypothetical protein